MAPASTGPKGVRVVDSTNESHYGNTSMEGGVVSGTPEPKGDGRDTIQREATSREAALVEDAHVVR
jgi:hypothetical protein